MLKSNRSSAQSLTPIETNTEHEYDAGYYNINPTMSHTPAEPRTTVSNEGNNMVQIRVMDSDNREAEEVHFYGDYETDEDHDNDSDDSSESNGIGEENNDVENMDAQKADIDMKYQDQDDDRDRIKADGFKSYYEITPAIKDQSRDNSDSMGSLSKYAEEQPNSKYSPENQSTINNLVPESIETENETGIFGESYRMDEIRSKNKESYNFGEDKSTSCQNHNANERVSDLNTNQTSFSETQISESNSRDELDTNHTVDKHDQTSAQFNPQRKPSSQSHDVTNHMTSLTDDFFDRNDSVEMDYFASFQEPGSSNVKTQNVRDDVLNQHTNDVKGSKNVDQVSLDTPNESKLRENTPDYPVRSEDNMDTNFAKLVNYSKNESTSNNDSEKYETGSLSNDSTQSQNNDKVATETDSIIGNDNNKPGKTNDTNNVFINGVEDNEEQFGLKVDNVSEEETRSKTPVGDEIYFDNDDKHSQEHNSEQDFSRDKENIAASSDTNVVLESNQRDEGVLQDESPRSEKGLNMNEGCDEGGEDAGMSEINESYSLSEPDEQTILRVFISKNDKEENEIDISSEIMQLSEHIQDNDNGNKYSIDGPSSKRNKHNRKNKSTKQTPKDKNKNMSSPYSMHTFKYDNDTRAVERLKNGPYAEVFKRDAPKIQQKSKNSKENTKRNKTNEKLKAESVKKERKGINSARSPSKTKIKGKAIHLTNKRKLTERATDNHEDASTGSNFTEDNSENNSIVHDETESNEDTCLVENKLKTTELKTNERATTSGDKDIFVESATNQGEHYSKEMMDVRAVESEQRQEDRVPEVVIDYGAEIIPENAINSDQTEQEKTHEEPSILTTSNETNESKSTKETDDEPKIKEIKEPKESDLDIKIQSDDTCEKVKSSSEKELKTTTEEEIKPIQHEERNPITERETKFTTEKVSKAALDKEKKSQIRNSSAKKKIIISSPKTTAKMAMKSKQMSEKAKNSPKMQSSLVNKKTNKKTKEDKTSNIETPAKDPNIQIDTTLEPATITVIDETSEIDERANGRAGRLIINNIRNKLRKNSIKRHTSNSSVASIQLITNSRPSSPDEKGLNTSLPHQGRTAYKTQSMSSLQVPGHLSTSNPWDPTKEEDTISIGSRRPSMDSVSRKSVDYRIRNTTMVIQPHNDDKSKSAFAGDDSYSQGRVPCLPMSLAVFCLILNIIMPGSGTVLSGLSVLCCGHSRSSPKEDQMLNALCANLFVGIAQLFTVSFMLVGWFWSISWGIQMVSVSARHREELKQQREKDLQAMALSAFGSPKKLNLFSS